MKRALALLVCVLFLALATLHAQLNCNASNNSSTMICAVPQIYDPGSLVSSSNTAAFQNYQFASTTPAAINGMAMNATIRDIGTELTTLPLASPASGILFTFDRSLGVVMRSSESFGPIMGERAETIGRHRLFVAAAYQYFPFSSLDGLSLEHVPGVYGSNDGSQNFMSTSTRVDLKVHQVTLYGTFGLTNRVDVSAAIPILDVRLGIWSNAQIIQGGSPGSSNAFAWQNFARGIGDVTFRAKGTVLKRERASLAIGTEVRLPTGDEKNFLGSGATGVKPFVTASYRARVTPHANLGYEFNGTSILGGATVGTEGRLPDVLFYSGGADVGITKRLTGAIDLLGQRLFGGFRVTEVPYVDASGNTHPGFTQFVTKPGSSNINDLAVGAKFSPIGNLLLTANMQFKLNDAGLRCRVIPLVGVAYAF